MVDIVGITIVGSTIVGNTASKIVYNYAQEVNENKSIVVTGVDAVFVSESPDHLVHIKVFADQPGLEITETHVIGTTKGTFLVYLQLPKSLAHLWVHEVRGLVYVNNVCLPTLKLHGSECEKITVQNSTLQEIFNNGSLHVSDTSCEELKVYSWAGVVDIQNLTAKNEVILHSATGSVSIVGGKLGMVQLLTTSGSLSAEGVECKNLYVEDAIRNPNFADTLSSSVMVVEKDGVWRTAKMQSLL